MVKSSRNTVPLRAKIAWWGAVALLLGVFVFNYLHHSPERRRAEAFRQTFEEKVLGGTKGEVVDIVGRPDETARKHTTEMFYYDREFQRNPSKNLRLLVVFQEGHAMRVSHIILK